jgi:hypothetical protein
MKEEKGKKKKERLNKWKIKIKGGFLPPFLFTLFHYILYSFQTKKYFMEEVKIQMTAQMKAALSHFIAKKDRAISDLEVYLNRPVGVGEHSNITEEVITKLEELEHSNSMIQMINSMVVQPNEEMQNN